MADVSHQDYLPSLCDEIILRILSFLDRKSVVKLSQTCKRFYCIGTFDQRLWCRLCFIDFSINLASPGPFFCFRNLYIYLYKSREILKVYLSERFQNSTNYRYGVLPSWLWTWVVMNTSPPLLPSWIRTYHDPFLRFKLSEISLGKVMRVWNLKSSDLPRHLVARVEYGTSYYRWRDVQMAAMRVHGGQAGLERFLLKRCARARGYVERSFQSIRDGTFLVERCSKSTIANESTAQSELPSTSSNPGNVDQNLHVRSE